MNLNDITPENKTEELILQDLRELCNQHHELPISVLLDELEDDPEAYEYDIDDLNQFLFKYNIPEDEI